MVQIKNLILDYDGVVCFKDKELTRKAIELLINVLGKQDHEFVLHINSLRGISLFKNEAFKKLKDSVKNKIQIFFSGCAGSFTYNINKEQLIEIFGFLSANDLNYLIHSTRVKQILTGTGQNDFELYKDTLDNIPLTLKEIISLEPRLYWDCGFPGSKNIFKCAIDVNEQLNELYKDLSKNLPEDLKMNLTNNIVEITNRKSDKGSVMRRLLQQKMYTDGNFLIIGDNPQDADKPMMEAFSGLAINRKIFTMSNGLIKKSGINEKEREVAQANKFLEIINKVFVS